MSGETGRNRVGKGPQHNCSLMRRAKVGLGGKRSACQEQGISLGKQ